MENIPDDELISAYLDGELTGKDLDRAEQLLASQPDSRQMLDELTALRASLNALPQQKLGPEFAESVLRRAEREMLQPGVASSAGVTGAGALPTPVDTWKPEVPPILSMSRWTRPLVWAALTTAAAIMIMMFSPPDAKQKVAVAPPVAAGPGPADLAMQAPAADAPNKDAAIATGAPAIAAPESGQNGFFAGSGGAARGAVADQATVRQTPEPFSVGAAESDDAPLLVVLCDVTPEVARSASFRRLLAEHQIPWQDERSGDNALETAPAFAAQESAGAGKEADATVADKRKPADPSPVTKQGDVAADALQSVPTEVSAEPSSTEAVYVIAAPSQVDATIAAIAGNTEFRNVQMKELTGPLPQELRTENRENRGQASNFDAAQNNAVQDNAAQPYAATADSERGRPALGRRKIAPKAEEANRNHAPPNAKSTRMATTAVAPTAAANAPGAADAVTSPLAQPAAAPLLIAQPSVARAEPASLSNATIAELSRAVGHQNSAVDEQGSEQQGQSSDQAADNKNKQSDKRPADEKQTGRGAPRDGAPGERETRGGDAGDQKDGAKDPSQQQKLQLGKGEAAPDGDGEGSLGGAQPRTGNAATANLKAGQSKVETEGRKESAPLKPDGGGAKRPTETTAAPADRRPAAAPDRAETIEPRRTSGLPGSAPASVASETNWAGGQVEALDARPKQESTKSLEGASARRAIFLFRVVPAPVAAPQR